MKIDRKWIALALLLASSMLFIGCPKEAPEPPPPPAPAPPPPAPPPPPPPPPPAPDPVEPPPPPSLAELQDQFERQGLLGDVFFAFDKYDLRPDARERLEKNAEFMNSEQGRSFTFTIEGHCDERGTNEYNLALGQQRSTSALDFLAGEMGIERSRFKTVSYGEERPFCTESTEACWQKNRRARFVITGER